MKKLLGIMVLSLLLSGNALMKNFKKPEINQDEKYEKKFKKIFNLSNRKILKKFINDENKLRLKPGIIWGRDSVDTRIEIKFYQTWVDIDIPNQNRSISNRYQNLLTPEKAELYSNRGDLRCEVISENKLLVKTHIIENNCHHKFNEKKFNITNPKLIIDYIKNQICKIIKEGYGSK
jgi:hypothetical protein